jgi:hypothetical protein
MQQILTFISNSGFFCLQQANENGQLLLLQDSDYLGLARGK